ncbi:Jerky protein [Biomphalaria pfeifferi]|uniref:Jerky protein n=1 Tax=Biomphalaria pfeifferi TaxID=112525 RepID=A0AAD8B5Q3_BIOPF|nr:Jerky protein [Biomphalaria pfeifferi]
MKSKKKSKKSPRSRKSPEKKLSVVLPAPGIKSDSPNPQKQPIKKRRLYSREALQAAYKAVKDSSISVNAAAKLFGVPLTTLRDRVDGRISIDTTRPGPPLLMTDEEEAHIAHFLFTMARYGYRYTRLELAEIATDLAVEKGKRDPRSNGLTTKWVDSFINRWPTIRELSCKLRNKSDAEHTVRTYFDEIKKIIDRYKLLEKNDSIFNIMEITLNTDHGIVSGKAGHQFKTDNYTNTTLIACGSVSGKVIPPFFVFQSNRLRPEMMKGMPANVNASVSDTGKCSPQIFRRYLNEHFLAHVEREENEPILVLMDGSRSHVFVGMSEWGRQNNVIFSFIPAHTTHLLQPLEVDCSEALKHKYESARRRYLKSAAGPCYSRNSIGEIACQAYSKVVNRAMLMHSFKKAGVYPDISSDESEDEMETCDVDAYKRVSLKQEDSTEDEIVFTEDLVVGHNQEVTEEEVVTTQEVVLTEDGGTEEVIISPDCTLMLTQNGEVVMGPNGHLVFHGSELFANSTEGGFSQLQLIQSVEGLDEPSPTKSDGNSVKVSPVKQCIVGVENILADPSLEIDIDSDLNSTDNGTDSINSTDTGTDSLNSTDESCHLSNVNIKVELDIADDLSVLREDSESGQGEDHSVGVKNESEHEEEEK